MNNNDFCIQVRMQLLTGHRVKYWNEWWLNAIYLCQGHGIVQSGSLYHCHVLLGLLNRIEPLFMLIVTIVVFCPSKVKMSAVKWGYGSVRESEGFWGLPGGLILFVSLFVVTHCPVLCSWPHLTHVFFLFPLVLDSERAVTNAL